jgi:hypothetical protein
MDARYEWRDLGFEVVLDLIIIAICEIVETEIQLDAPAVRFWSRQPARVEWSPNREYAE